MLCLFWRIGRQHGAASLAVHRRPDARARRSWLLLGARRDSASAGRERAFALGLMASQRNMGLMVAATGNALPELAWLYFALCQFPIYLSP
jgi:hypothetical protein